MNAFFLAVSLLFTYSVGFAEDPPDASPTPNVAQPQTLEKAPAPVNCQYHISQDTKQIDSDLLKEWSQKAALQAFDFNPDKLDTQMNALKSCFTEQGWIGYNDALQKSGNLNAIRTQKLTVSGQVDGEASINPVKDNQWKITLPMQVVYQNDKEKLTQLLMVDLLVGRKITGDLGIMQMIATTRPQHSSTPGSPAPNHEASSATGTESSPSADTIPTTPTETSKPEGHQS